MYVLSEHEEHNIPFFDVSFIFTFSSCGQAFVTLILTERIRRPCNNSMQ